uniref:Uncharacterized protein n=1 Tax=Coccidioides posadasii RMSCC 3488 TaxID=454284 RepID=A0A0J6FLL4_COCPO|nr:hypothetical protein CPAG_07545 [Coccidioides posadasii RMSCC 3488]
MARAPANPMLFALKDQPEKHRQSSKVPSVRGAPEKKRAAGPSFKSMRNSKENEPEEEWVTVDEKSTMEIPLDNNLWNCVAASEVLCNVKQAGHEIRRLNPSHRAGSQGNEIWKRDGTAQLEAHLDNLCLTSLVD